MKKLAGEIAQRTLEANDANQPVDNQLIVQIK
jgi:hypothetical protein